MTQTSISTITPINRDELVRLSEKAKANPGAVSEAANLASTPLERSARYSATVMELRLQTAELALRAAESALLHSGAKGFIITGAPQRRMREAMFFAILMPSIKHLRKELAK